MGARRHVKTCDLCFESTTRPSARGWCNSCEAYAAYYATLTPAEGRADKEAIAQYVAECERDGL